MPHSVGKNFWSYLSPSPDLSSFLVALSPATQIINKPKFGFKQKVNLTTMVTVTIDQDQHQLIDDNAYRDEEAHDVNDDEGSLEKIKSPVTG